jgi:hypothetical protein
LVGGEGRVLVWGSVREIDAVLDGSMRLDRVLGKVCSYSPYKVRKRIPYEDMIYKHLVT